MTELVEADDTSGLAQARPSAELVTAGELLRRAREAAGLHIGALAVSLKVPVKKLEALEANQFDALPDAVFARALASSVCRTLKIDPKDILDKLPQNTVQQLKVAEEGINAPFRPKGGGGVSVSAGQYLSKPAVVIVGLLLLAALIVVVMPARQNDAGSVVSSPVRDLSPVPPMVSEVPPPAVASAAAPAASAVSSPVLSAASAATTTAVSVAVAASAVAPLAVQPLPVASAAVSAPGPAPGPAPAPAPATDGLLVLKATAPSWVQVTDAKGVVQLSKTLVAGESVAVSGALPLAAVVGRVDATEALVRGKVLNLLPMSKDNVARFEVK